MPRDPGGCHWHRALITPPRPSPAPPGGLRAWPGALLRLARSPPGKLPRSPPWWALARCVPTHCRAVTVARCSGALFSRVTVVECDLRDSDITDRECKTCRLRMLLFFVVTMVTMGSCIIVEVAIYPIAKLVDPKWVSFTW